MDGKERFVKRAFSLYPCLAVLATLMTACGIEGFESQADPNPPMGLTVTSETNAVILRFTTYNYEDGFTGFNVYVGTSPTYARDKQYVLSNAQSGTLPTFKITSNFQRPTVIELVLNQEYWTKHPFNGTLTATTFDIGVAAWNAIQKKASTTSDTKTVTLVSKKAFERK